MSVVSDKLQGDMDKTKDIHEVGIVGYKGAQAAAVLGMTDLLTAADGFARKMHAIDHPPTSRESLDTRRWAGCA